MSATTMRFEVVTERGQVVYDSLVLEHAVRFAVCEVSGVWEAGTQEDAEMSGYVGTVRGESGNDLGIRAVEVCSVCEVRTVVEGQMCASCKMRASEHTEKHLWPDW